MRSHLTKWKVLTLLYIFASSLTTEFMFLTLWSIFTVRMPQGRHTRTGKMYSTVHSSASHQGELGGCLHAQVAFPLRESSFLAPGR